jgi:hypothetical protein
MPPAKIEGSCKSVAPLATPFAGSRPDTQVSSRSDISERRLLQNRSALVAGPPPLWSWECQHQTQRLIEHSKPRILQLDAR